MAYHSPTFVTVYGDNDYAPYSYELEGEAKGVYVDILRAAFKKMPDYRVNIVLIPWKRGLKMLEAGKGFALFPPYYYANQRPYISPYSEPILAEEVAVFCNDEKVDGRELSNWPAGYKGLKIGVNESFALGGDDFWQAVNKGEIKVESAKGNRANIINLYKQRTDCYVNDRLSILWEVKQLMQKGDISNNWGLTDGQSVSSEFGYLGFTNVQLDNYPYKDDFVEQFNRSLIQLKQDGTVKTIISKYTLNE